MKKPRVIVWDIETSLMMVSSFTLYPEAISIKNIIEDWHIICASWITLDSDVVHSVYCYGNDYKVVKKLREVLMNADILVAHNGDKFDLRKFNARLIYHNLPPLPPIKTIDTLKEIRKVANISSNKLDYLGTFLKIGSKLHTDTQLWIDVLKKNKKAVRTMVMYNKQDVVILRSIYLRLRKYFRNQPSIYDGIMTCDQCGSSHVKNDGTRRSKFLGSYQQYRCMDCLHYMKGTRRGLRGA